MAQLDTLDDLFAAAAEQRVTPSDALVSRIMADAAEMQPKPQRLAPVAGPGWFATLADWFGGGLSLAGMAAAAITGLYLGVAQPTAVLALSDYVTGTTTGGRLELLPSTGMLWAQE